MSAVLEPRHAAGGKEVDVNVKLAFSKKLQVVTNRIHSTQNVDEIILDVSKDICQLFEADRMTVYITSEDGSSIVSKVKTGLNSFKDIKLPISESSLAGYAALNKRHMNIKDVYDDAELKQYSPNLTFLKAVDQRTGYRSKQMLIAPILGGDTGQDLMGVIQLINNLAGQPFSSLHDEGVAVAALTTANQLHQERGGGSTSGAAVKVLGRHGRRDNEVQFVATSLSHWLGPVHLCAMT